MPACASLKFGRLKLFGLASAILLVCLFSVFSNRQAQAKADLNPSEPLLVYTALTATTAQLPLFEAFRAGWPGSDRRIIVEYWKNLDDLRSLVLAGKGDIWVGHLEGLARASTRGAPVTLVAATVWQKFFFVSAPLPLNPGAPDRLAESTEELLDFVLKNGEVIGSAPQNGPCTNLLKALGEPDLTIETMAPQQLILELTQGTRRVGLLPEPVATAAKAKVPSLKIIGSLEAEYSRRLGGPALIPQAGVAVNLELAQREPALVAKLVELIEEGAINLAALEPGQAALRLPKETIEAVGQEILTLSLAAEPIIAKSAASCQSEIEDFLKIAAPDLYEPSSPHIPDSFFFKAPSAPVD
ncbi:MAG: hypothetical protein LBT47_11685 [Deltaproteobacteria bacterium]|jgi:NitT/TauT family transport system substrate-binding protein|nr:hypothetical protein [Deltaproteobacteria bacterium]